MGARLKRWVYLLHRWMGIAGCVLILLWFVSGIVMLFVGYPKLTPWERLGALPVLPQAACCVPVSTFGDDAAAAGVRLTSIRGEPQYVLGSGASLKVVSVAAGVQAGVVDEQAALASARAFAPESQARHAGLLDEDRWTRSTRLNPHRPLHRVELEGPWSGALYVSSATGEVVLDASTWQQRLNYVGAWLHWLYMFRMQAVDPRWSWTVIALSVAGTLVALSGILVGLWRWRFRSRYASGSRSPFREPWMRWHHVVGLSFSFFILAWVFSGLMSMNPLGIFSAYSHAPDRAAYRGEQHLDARLAQPESVLKALGDSGFEAVELEWKWLGGQAYVLAFDRHARSRIVTAGEAGAGLRLLSHWAEADVLPAASGLFPEAVAASALLTHEDAYYYQRHPEAMNGHLRRGLPALRLDFADVARTRVYIDLTTGEVASSLSRSQRVGRWLFYFLHSWDVPVMLQQGLLRDAVLILLSLGGIVVSATGVVLGWRRLRRGRL